MLYAVYVQGKLYKTVDAQFTDKVLVQVTQDIQSGFVPDFDFTQPSRIIVRPAHLPELSPAAADDLFNAPPALEPVPSAETPSAPVLPKASIRKRFWR